MMSIIMVAMGISSKSTKDIRNKNYMGASLFKQVFNIENKNLYYWFRCCPNQNGRQDILYSEKYYFGEVGQLAIYSVFAYVSHAVGSFPYTQLNTTHIQLNISYINKCHHHISALATVSYRGGNDDYLTQSSHERRHFRNWLTVTMFAMIPKCKYCQTLRRGHQRQFVLNRLVDSNTMIWKNLSISRKLDSIWLYALQVENVVGMNMRRLVLSSDLITRWTLPKKHQLWGFYY